MSHRRAILLLLGVAWVGVPTLVACRGVLGIHDLTYDGGPDATKEAATGDDATDDSTDDTGEADAGHDAGSAKDAAVDSGHDVGVEAGHDTGRDVGVDARPDVGVDAGHDVGVDAGESDADLCVRNCISMNGGTGTGTEVAALLARFNPTMCSCGASCGTVCSAASCMPLSGETASCQTCLVELITTNAGSGPCGMPLGGCQDAAAGCQALGGCLHTCMP